MDLSKTDDQFAMARQAGFVELKKLKDQGKGIVGLYCAFTPHELIRAGGLIPVTLCGVSNEPVKDAEMHLPVNLCPLIKSSYGHAITDTCPFFYFSDIVIGETTCDGKKKMYELINEIKPMHMMYLPKSAQGEAAVDLWLAEIMRLKERLESQFAIKITSEALTKEIKIANKERQSLKDFYELGKISPPVMWGTELFQVLDGSEFIDDSDSLCAALAKGKAEKLERFNRGNSPVPVNAPRILLTGSPIGGAIDKVLQPLEEAGATVVAFENCGAIRTTEDMVEEDDEPFRALAKKYVNTGCACMSPNSNRMRLLRRIITEYQVDGVVEAVLQSCHTFNVESALVRKIVQEEYGLPYLKIETDYAKSDFQQLAVRLGAFSEMVRSYAQEQRKERS